MPRRSGAVPGRLVAVVGAPVPAALAGLLAADLALRARSLLRRRDRRARPPGAGASSARCDPAWESLLLRVLCHELRSPISTLTALTRRLADERQTVPAADRRAMLSLVRDQAAHLDGIWRQVVAWTRGTTGGGDPPVPLARILPVLAAAWPPDQVRLSVSPSAARRPVDAQRMRQVLQNLVDNALRHGPRRGRVHLTATVRAGDLVIVVADEGSHCADLLAALDRPTPPSGVSGLGLWIVRRLVGLDGGTVRAYPVRPRGVAVEVSLPARPNRPGSSRGAGPDRRPRSAGRPRSTGRPRPTRGLVRVGRALAVWLGRGWPGRATGWPGRAAVPGTRAMSLHPTGGHRVQPYQGSAVHGEAGRT